MVLIEESSVSPIAGINGKYYYGVYNQLGSNNFAVYCMDSNGNPVTEQITVSNQ